jgi:CRP-like cAMP-binding protein
MRASDELHALLLSVSPIPDDEWLWLAATLKGCEFEPGEALFRQQGEDAGVHYLQSGLVRYFYLTEQGIERNHTFAAEGNLSACLPAYVGAGPCTFTVEAIEPTRTVQIPSHVFLSLDDRHECWLRLKLRLMQHVALRKEGREASFLLDSAEARYRRFLADYKRLHPRIPQYHIASYLGITPVALSRIRKRINPG